MKRKYTKNVDATKAHPSVYDTAVTEALKSACRKAASVGTLGRALLANVRATTSMAVGRKISSHWIAWRLREADLTIMNIGGSMYIDVDHRFKHWSGFEYAKKPKRTPVPPA